MISSNLFKDGNKMPQRVADYFVIAGLDFANPHSLRLPGENHNQGNLYFINYVLLE